jgi:hypothetical protein
MRYRITFFSFILLVAVTLGLSAQTINITGKIINSNGDPVYQAKASLLIAGIFVYTDAGGNFTLYQDNTGIEKFTTTGDKSTFDGKKLYLNCNNDQVQVKIFDLSGKEIATVLSMKSLSGKFMIYPEAYIDSRYHSILIIQSVVGEETRTFKFFPAMQSIEEKGLFEVTSMENSNISSALKSALAIDTLMIQHDSYTSKKIPIDSKTCFFGDITLFDKLPVAPDQLTANAPNSYSVVLNWRDNSNNENGFKIEKASWQVMEWSEFTELIVLSPNVTEYTDNGLIQSHSYKYRVCAFNDGGNSPFTEEVVARTQISNPISISGPGTSTGSFSIEVSYSWPGMFGSTSDRFELEESTSPTSGFTKIDNSPWGSRPDTYTFNLTRSTGTYYFRARANHNSFFTEYTDVIGVSVNTPVQKAYLKVINNTHYGMIDIRLNNQQLVDIGYAVLPGDNYTFEFSSSGVVNFVLGVGFWDGNSRDVWFILSGNTNVTVGTTTTLTFNNPTIGQILSGFSSSKNWTGEYWDANLNMHMAAFKFTSNGSWTFYDDGVANGSGTVTLVSWPDYSLSISFKICPGCDVITMFYPFAQFYYNNGPANWRQILYTGQ